MNEQKTDLVYMSGRCRVERQREKERMAALFGLIDFTV
jgi:hypothetical protein